MVLVVQVKNLMIVLMFEVQVERRIHSPIIDGTHANISTWKLLRREARRREMKDVYCPLVKPKKEMKRVIPSLKR